MKQYILIIAIVALAGCFGKAPVKTGKEGKPMPEFSMLLTDSVTWLHSANIPKGKPTVLFYFSPYCPFCKAQTKAIIEDMENLHNLNFYLVSNPNFQFSSIKAFKKDFQLDRFPNITVGLDTTDDLTNYFEITGVPYIAIYKSDKTLSKSFEGKVYPSQIKKAAEE